MRSRSFRFECSRFRARPAKGVTLMTYSEEIGRREGHAHVESEPMPIPSLNLTMAFPWPSRSIHSLQFALAVLDQHGILPLHGTAEFQKQIIEIVFSLCFGIEFVRPTRSGCECCCHLVYAEINGRSLPAPRVLRHGSRHIHQRPSLPASAGPVVESNADSWLEHSTLFHRRLFRIDHSAVRYLLILHSERALLKVYSFQLLDRPSSFATIRRFIGNRSRRNTPCP